MTSLPFAESVILVTTIFVWVIDPEGETIIDNCTHRDQEHPDLNQNTFTVEESCYLRIEQEDIRDDIGILVRVPFEGIQTIDNFLRRWCDNYGHEEPERADFPRVMTGVMGEVNLWHRTDYYFLPMIAPPANPNAQPPTRSIQLETRQITTDGQFYRWMRDTANQKTRFMRLILHRGNRDLAEGLLPIPNSPILNPQRLNPPPLYLPERTEEEWLNCLEPCLPFSGAFTS